MRNNLILILLIVLASPVQDSDAQLFGRRRANRSPAPQSSSPCPGGVCPVPGTTVVPSQSSGAPFGYQNLTTPQYEARPVAPAPVVVQAQPAQAAVVSPPPQPAAASAAQAFSKAKFDELLAELEKLTGVTAVATTPPVAQPPAPPTPPQAEPSPSPTTSQASEVVRSLGTIEVVHRDGTGKAVAAATIDLSEFVRREIGANQTTQP